MISLLKGFYRKNFNHPRCGNCESKLDYKQGYGKWGCPEGCHPKHYPTNSRGKQKPFKRFVNWVSVKVERVV